MMYFSGMRHRDDATPQALDRRRQPQVYHGWALAAVIEIDHLSPGLLAASFRFGIKRRQAMFLVLGLVEVLGLEEVVAHLRKSEHAAKFEDQNSAYILGQSILRLRRPRDLVAAVVAGPPRGLLGTLGRLGLNPCTPRVYHEIARVFLSRNPDDRRRAKILGQIERGIVGAQIEIVSKLDPVLLHARFVAKLYEPNHVEEAHQALGMIRKYCSAANDEAVRTSLTQLRCDGHRSDLVRAWANRFDRLPNHLDVGNDETLVLLDTATKMKDAGRRYKNCLGDKIYEAFLGVSAFVECRPTIDGPGIIVELRRTSVGFFLQGMYAANNRRVHSDRADLVRRKLISCGVAILDCAPDDREAVRATARMLDCWTLGDPDNQSWGDEPLDAVADLRRALEAA